MYHLQRNEMYRLGDNAQKSYVVHRRLTIYPVKANYYITNDLPSPQRYSLTSIRFG